MSSKSNEVVETSPTSVAMDNRTVVEEGQAIVDSIIYSNDATVVDASMKNNLAMWEAMVKGGNLNLMEITQFGGELVNALDKGQIKMSDTAQQSLRQGLEMFEELTTANKLNVELTEMVADRSFDLADSSLSVIADVKTGDFTSLSSKVMIFALGAMVVSAWVIKGKT